MRGHGVKILICNTYLKIVGRASARHPPGASSIGGLKPALRIVNHSRATVAECRTTAARAFPGPRSSLPSRWPSAARTSWCARSALCGMPSGRRWSGGPSPSTRSWCCQTICIVSGRCRRGMPTSPPGGARSRRGSRVDSMPVSGARATSPGARRQYGSAGSGSA